MRHLKDNIFLILLLITVFILISFLVYQQIFSAYASDTISHLAFTYLYFDNQDETFHIPHPLWHYSIHFINKITHISLEYSAVIFSAFLVTVWTYFIYLYHKSKLTKLVFHKYSNLLIVIITTMTIIISPLCLPFLNQIIYLGQGSPNVWHNVTLWTVKPLAFISIIFFLKVVKEEQISYYLIIYFSTVLSLFAKPSFAIMFLPAILIFAVIKKINYHQFKIFYILLILSSLIILMYQFLHTFSPNNESQIIFDLFGVWSNVSSNIALSIVLALAFPMLLLLLKPQIINDDSILFSWIMIFIGIVLYSLFAQTGRFYNHGNFVWSYLIAMSFVYLFSITKYFEIFQELKIYQRYVLLSLLLVQVFTGIYYFVKILQGQNPIYIILHF